MSHHLKCTYVFTNNKKKAFVQLATIQHVYNNSERPQNKIRKEEMLYIFLLPSFFLRVFLLVKYRMVLFLQASTFFFK